MKKRISYKTAYDSTEMICGYVLAEDRGSYYEISHRAFKNAFKRRTVGGDAGIIFLADKPVYAFGKDGSVW